MDSGGILLDLGSVTLPLSCCELFGEPLPLEVELGVGKGRFLLEWASSRPGVGFVGVERARTYLRIAAQRVARSGLTNVRLAHTTAEDLLFRCLAPGSVAAVHVYFPDPWPKKRHHKRRFFRPENVARVAEVLLSGGLLRVKTDHEGYASVVAEVVRGETRLERVPADRAFEGVPATHFEIKYTHDERAVARLAFRRV